MSTKTLPTREIIFGLEDGIVSTPGVLVGIAVGTNNRPFIILSGLVVIFVESLSTAASTYLSNKSHVKNGLEMMSISAMASLVGFAIGKLASRVLINLPS